MVDEAADLLRDVNLIYGLVSGVMLKFAFEWSSQQEKYNRSQSWLAVGLSIGSLAFASVLVTLMAEVAFASIARGGVLSPTLVVYWLVFLVVVTLVGISLVALVRSVRHLKRVMRT